MTKKSSGKRRIWFRSTPAVIVAIFIISFVISFFWFGIEETLRAILFYSLGISGVSIVVYLIFKAKGQKVKRIFD